MAVSNTTDPESTTIAVVTIRIPCGTDGDLVTDAEKRLSRPETIDDVTIDELDSIEPQLSANSLPSKLRSGGLRRLARTGSETDWLVSRDLSQSDGLHRPFRAS